MMIMRIELHKIPQARPDDVAGLDQRIAEGKLDPSMIVAILGKTEGNGCVNDFTRGFATQTLKAYLGQHLGPEAGAEIVYIMSGGTEGVLSPHLNVFTRQPDAPEHSPRWGLVMGTGRTRDFTAAEVGSLTMVETVAAAVTAAIAKANLTPENVHFVQIKCPLVTAAKGAHQSSSYQSMAHSRGAAALGVALALGELPPSQMHPGVVGQALDLYSRTASTSAGGELQNCEILVLGNADHSTSDLVIGHDVMHHALDIAALHRAIASTHCPMEQVVSVFAKAEADPSGQLLGCRHTMLDDSDISHTRMARAVVGAALASVVQDPMIYVSGGSEHQGPPGGGPVAVIASSH